MSFCMLYGSVESVLIEFLLKYFIYSLKFIIILKYLIYTLN